MQTVRQQSDAGSSSPGGIASVVPVSAMVSPKHPGANPAWRLLKRCPQSQCQCLHPCSLLQLPNSRKEEGPAPPCHQHKGQSEAATNTDSPRVNFAKSLSIPLPGRPTSLGMNPLSFLKVGSHFRLTFLTSGNLFSHLWSPLAGLKPLVAAFIAGSLDAKQMLRARLLVPGLSNQRLRHIPRPRFLQNPLL